MMCKGIYCAHKTHTQSLFIIVIAFICLFISPITFANKTEVKKKSAKARYITIVAIDPGHGGKDPGATGKKFNVREKDVTLAISRELKSLLDADPNFKAVLTRSGDYFVQLPERSEIARKNKANYLISIHADTSPRSNTLRGASVWVLSNQRASDEMGKWLEDHEKQSELLGGAGSVLAHTNEIYLNQTVLDLQFSHSQRIGYELGKSVLSQLNKITPMVKSTPQHASLSVLRSPDIPSILVETGFLSNPYEEEKLASASYRRQIAYAIYSGLIAHRNKNSGIPPIKTATNTPKITEKAKPAIGINPNQKKSNSISEVQTNKPQSNSQKKDIKNNTVHIVKKNETLYAIAKMYNTTPDKLRKINNLRNDIIWVGKKIKIKSKE